VPSLRLRGSRQAAARPRPNATALDVNSCNTAPTSPPLPTPPRLLKATPSSRQRRATCHVSQCLCELRALHHLTHHHRDTNTHPAQVTNIAIPPPPPIPSLITALESPNTPPRRLPPSNPASRSSSARNTSRRAQAPAAERCTISQPRKS